MREDEAEEQEIEGEEWEEEVVTPSANGFRSDDEDMICFARCVCSCVCVFVCSCVYKWRAWFCDVINSGAKIR